MGTGFLCTWVLHEIWFSDILGFPHITKIYHATQHVRDSYAYLNIERIKLHRLVALAWVYNPAPNEFTCVDHIDGERMNNHASNLRWLNAALNMQNRSSERATTSSSRMYS